MYTQLAIFIFPLTIAAGVGVGMLWTVLPISVFPDLVRRRFEAGSLALLGAWMGGRLAYVSINWAYFQSHLVEIPQVWLGGISWIGVVAGGCLAVPVIARIRRISSRDLADGLRPLFTSIVVSAWLASWLTGSAYGVEAKAWWGIPAANEWGILLKRWPTQMLGALLALGVHWAVDQLVARQRVRTPGLAALLELEGFFVSMMAISPFRGDPAPQWAGIRLEIWASVFFTILALVLVFSITLRRPRSPKIKKQSGDYEV